MRSLPNHRPATLALLVWLLSGAAYLVLSHVQISPTHAQDPELSPKIVRLTELSPTQPLPGCPPVEAYQNEELRNEDEPNKKLAASTHLTESLSFRGHIYPASDQDHYQFVAVAGQRFSAATSTTASHYCSKDTQLALYDTGGNLLAADDNSGAISGETASSIAGYALPGNGTYFLRVSGSGSGTIQPYHLYTNLYTPPLTDEVEPNGTLGAAQILLVSKTVSGTVSSGTDLDFFKMTLNAGDTVFLSLDMDPNRTGAVWDGRVGLGVFNGFIVVGDDANTETPRSEAMTWTVRDAGTYYAFVDGDGAPSSGSYHLSVNVFPGANGFNCTTYPTVDIPKAIGPSPGRVESTITITPTTKIADLNAKVLISHSLPSDLQLTLESPNGTSVPLVWNVGDTRFKLLQTEFDDEAAIPPAAIYEHTIYQPQAPNRLAAFNGQNPNGTWKLVLTDTVTTNSGILYDWQLEICEGAKPDAPIQVLPANHADVKKQKVRFDWTPSFDALTYRLLVREDSKKGPKVVDKKGLTASEVKANLPAGHAYFWRLFACNVYGCTPSGWFDFERK